MLSQMLIYCWPLLDTHTTRLVHPLTIRLTRSALCSQLLSPSHMCQDPASASCFFDCHTLPARRSASKRSRFDDHGPLQDPRGRQTDRCRVFDPLLSPCW